MRKVSKKKVRKPKLVAMVLSPSSIAWRLRWINVEEFVHGIFDAIDEAKGMAGALPPEECDEAREGLDQLRKTVVFVFGADR